MAIADTRLDRDCAGAYALRIDEAEVARDESGRDEILARTDDDLAALRANLAHV